MNTPVTGSRHVVVGVDGSAPSDDALRWGRYLARTIDGSLEVVFVSPTINEWVPAGMAGEAIGLPKGQDPHHSAAHLLDQIVARVLGDDRPERLHTSVTHGSPAQSLIQLSEGAFMLVVGSRGRGGFTGLLLGSVSAVCAAHARCPVLVIHGQTPPPS